MKPKRLLLSLALLPTITETLEDSATLGVPTHPSSSSSSQSQDEYMTSIQALACPVLTPSCGPVRSQKTSTNHLFSKPQGRHCVSASLPCTSPRKHRTPRTFRLGLEGPNGLTPGKSRERVTGDPVDLVFGQNQNQTQTLTRTCGVPCMRHNLASSMWVL